MFLPFSGQLASDLPAVKGVSLYYCLLSERQATDTLTLTTNIKTQNVASGDTSNEVPTGKSKGERGKGVKKNLHGWQQRSIRMEAKPQQKRSQVQAGFWRAACCVWDLPLDGSTEFPGFKNCSPEPGSHLKSIFQCLVGREMNSPCWGWGRGVQKIAKHQCEMFLFAFFHQTKMFLRWFCYIPSQWLEDF